MTVWEEGGIRDVEDPARNAKSAKRLQPDDSFHCYSIATLSDAPSASLTVASSLSFWSRLGEMIHDGKTFLYPLSRIVRSSRLTSSIIVLVLSDKGGLTLRAGKGSVSKYGGLHAKSYTCANSLAFLAFLIFLNTLIYSTMMLHITTYVLIGPLIRVIRTYITSFTTLSIFISTSKTNNLGDISRYTLNSTLNSRLR